MFFGRFPRLSGWFHGQYICPTLCCRDAGLFIHSVRARVCVCVCVRERERERERERVRASAISAGVGAEAGYKCQEVA